jgi:hypothetical protein
MEMTRREFVAVGLAGTASLCVGGHVTRSLAAEPPAQPLDEDGYKLWLRYAPPGDVANNYRKVVQQVHVDGTSATSGIIRGEFRSATATMLGSAVPANENGLVDGTVVVVVGTPGNSAWVRDLNWIHAGTRKSPNGWSFKSLTPRNGATRFWSISADLANDPSRTPVETRCSDNKPKININRTIKNLTLV